MIRKRYSMPKLFSASLKPFSTVPGFARKLAYVLVFLLLLVGERSYGQCVSLTTLGSASSQSFNTLSNTAGSTTNNLTITGWFLTESGGGARDNEQYAVDNGASNVGDTYSYGTAAASDRAIGGLRSGTLIPVFGSCFTNNTGSTIASLSIAYTGEEWRLGTADRPDQLDFQYSLNATSLVTGTWVDANALDFITPNTAAPTGAKDGNAAANRTALSSTISGLSIPNGATFWIRWNDLDASGADDGLAVDDFSLTPNGAAPPDYTITTTGNAIVITDVSGNGETLDVSQSGININFNAAGRTYALDGGATTAFPVVVLLAGANAVTINAAAGNDVINIGAFTVNLPSLTINGGTGDDAVNFSDDITFVANAHLDVDMQNDDAIPGVDYVTVMANANLILSGTGTATVKVSRYVDINAGSSIETANGNLTVETNQQATPTTGSFYGVLINGGALKTSGSGTLTVKGKAGTDAVGGQKGIYVVNSGQISGGNSGPVLVTGTGGPSAGNFNDGVFVDANGAITSLGGNVSVTGLGNGTGSSETHFGVFVRSGGQITAGSTGSVTVHGTGAATAGSNNRGIVVFSTNARITSSGGNVSVTGQGGGTGSSAANWGVYLLNTGEITAGGSGTVTVAGTGGAFSGDSNYGVFIEGANARITSSGGAVSVTGQGGGSVASGSNYGVYVNSSGQITAGGSGTVTVQGTGGVASGINNYGILVTGTSSRITSTSGNVSVTGQGSGSAADIITQSAGAITSTSTTAGITLNSTNNGTWPNTFGTDVSTTATQKTTFGAGSKLNIDIDGLTVNTQYQQLGVIGMIDLNGAGLTFAGSTFSPTVGNTFTIVDNDGTDPVIGTFNGLAQGASIPNFLGSGLSATITYVGGTGNDVVLTVVNNVVCYADTDGDGFGDPNNSMTFAGSCGMGFVTDNTDCKDNDDSFYPGATEDCDGCDKDCDGITGDGVAPLPCGTPSPANCAGIQTCVPQPVPFPGACLSGGSYTACNNNPQPETCDGIDNNCDGMIDNGIPPVPCIPPGTPPGLVYGGTSQCQQGTMTCGGMCIGFVGPSAETCDGIDNDCDGIVDENVVITWYQDIDNDGFGNPAVTQSSCTQPMGYVSDNTDCNDNDDDINPGATEICDGIDNDCDTQTDEGLTFITYYTDADNDGYGTGQGQSLCADPGPGFATQAGDCNDGNHLINPGETEICDGIDNDCDTQIDEGLTFTTYYTDADGDGYGTGSGQSLCANPGPGFATQAGDCNDNDDSINPAATEICDGIDNDCDTQIDEGLTFTTYYTDADGDGYGTGSGQSLCANPGPGFATQAGDCNDGNATINPAATEICDGIDNNCNGQVDEPKPIGGAWSNSDVGAPGVNGSASISCNGGSEVINISASGFSTSSSDKLHLVYQTLCGNGEIIARVLNVQSGGWAGITLRESLAPGSKKVALKTQLSSVIRREFRSVTNGPASILNFNRPTHVWLRLVRSGGNFTGYTSVNGTAWDFAFSATLPMGGCLYAGLFAESINANVETNVSFDNVSITGTQNLAGGIPPFASSLDGLSVFVYPNPGNGHMALSVAGAPERNLQLEVTDMIGRIVRNVELPEGEAFTYPLDLSSEPAGVYFLRLRSENGVESVQRIVVQQ